MSSPSSSRHSDGLDEQEQAHVDVETLQPSNQEQVEEEGASDEEGALNEVDVDDAEEETAPFVHQITPGSWPAFCQIILGVGGQVTADIVDQVLLDAGLNSPVDLSNAQQLVTFNNMLRPLAALQLYGEGQQRRWEVFNFVDRMVTGHGLYDTPPGAFAHLRHLDLIHPLSLNLLPHLGGGFTNLTNNYGLCVPLVQAVTSTTCPQLRTLLHEFNFSVDDLAIQQQHWLNAQHLRITVLTWLVSIRLYNRNQHNV